jgi:hypothetical protein
MTTQILEPTALAGTSTDVTIAAGSTNTVAMFQGISADNLKLPDGISDFLLPAGDFLLFTNQSDGTLDKNDWAHIQLKDPDGEYFNSGMTLRHTGLFKTLGPGVWRLSKATTKHEFGFQSE